MIKTKRIWTAVIVLCMIFTLIPLSAFAENPYEGSCGKNLNWTYDTEKRTLTISGNGAMPNYPASSTAGSIAPWLNSTVIKKSLEKVEISNGVTNIGEYAFYDCENLKSVTIPDSVTSIGEGAFYCCAALTSITIPGSVTIIDDEAFSHCTGLTNVIIPGNVINIGESAFSSCDNLTSVTIQNGTKSIGTFAFSGCGNLENITIPDSIVSIGDQAFYATAYYNKWYDNSEQCNVLYIGHHLIKVDEWALNKSILEGSISGDYTVTTGTKTIAGCAFNGCDKLTSITIPDSVVSIGNHAFESCSGLTDMTIPESVTNIGDYAFYICSKLTDINVEAGNTAYCSENGILYRKEKTEIIRFPQNKSDTSFIIPNGVKSIACGAFSDCSNLTNITIPNSVKSIGDDAFNTCKALTSVTIPDGVLRIGKKTFYGCERMTSVTIPNSVLIIEEGAFENCLKSIKVNYIGSENEWNEVIGAGKNILSSTNINYLSGISVAYSDDGQIIVKPLNIEKGKTVILAFYSGDKFIDMKSKIYDGTTKITFETNQAYTHAKAMVWESLDSMIAVCGAKILE